MRERAIDALLSIYTLLTIIRMVLSLTHTEQYPHWSVRAVRRLTDPAFNMARKFVPPIGGTLDISGLVVLLVLYIVRLLLRLLLQSGGIAGMNN